MTSSHIIEPIAVDTLRLDMDNPRFVGLQLADESAMVRYLYEEADLKELLLSMQNSGYLDFEPIVVERGSKVVLEGNRRVASLRLLRDPALRRKLGIALPAADDRPTPSMPNEIRALLVNDRDAARKFIGYKHINGPMKWDAMAKAKYAADWHRSGGTSLREISRALGDTFNTVTRLVDGYRVYEQAVQAGFDPERRSARRFAFSHLYTALTRASVKEWLGIGEELRDPPIPIENIANLQQLMIWLYGQGDTKPAIIRSQNPDLNKLADVLGNPRALAMLTSTGNLSVAFEETETPATRLDTALAQAVHATETALGVAHSFDGNNGATYTLGERLYRAAYDLFKGMKDKRDRNQRLDDDL